MIFFVILTKVNMNIFKHKYTFVFLAQKYHLISVLFPKLILVASFLLFFVKFELLGVVFLLSIQLCFVRMSYKYSRQILIICLSMKYIFELKLQLRKKVQLMETSQFVSKLKYSHLQMIETKQTQYLPLFAKGTSKLFFLFSKHLLKTYVKL